MPHGAQQRDDGHPSATPHWTQACFKINIAVVQFFKSLLAVVRTSRAAKAMSFFLPSHDALGQLVIILVSILRPKSLSYSRNSHRVFETYYQVHSASKHRSA